MEYQNVINLIRSCKDKILSRGNLSIMGKGAFDIATNVDMEIQNYIQGELKSLYPSISFVGEEETTHSISNRYWLLDPIDGTTNFVHDVKISVISLALIEYGKPTLGIIYNPYTDDMFYAVKGQGAYKNGQRIHVNKDDVSHSLITFGTSPYNRQFGDETFDIVKSIFKDVFEVRRLGSAAYDLALVASGTFAGYFELVVAPWDIMAGILLVQEAGGQIYLEDNIIANGVMKSKIVATNGIIHQYLVNHVKHQADTK